MTTQEHLEWLHENEWSDSRIANWVSQKLNNLVSTGIFTSHETLGGDILPRTFFEGPSVRTISRWRREGTKPTSRLHAKLIFMLYKAEKGANE